MDSEIILSETRLTIKLPIGNEFVIDLNDEQQAWLIKKRKEVVEKLGQELLNGTICDADKRHCRCCDEMVDAPKH